MRPKKRMLICSIFVVIIILSSSVFAIGSAIDHNNPEEEKGLFTQDTIGDFDPITQSVGLAVCWNEHFDSIEEMTSSVDIIIDGEVVRIEQENRSGMVFSDVFVSVSKVLLGDIKEKQTIKIVQIGGVLSNGFILAPDELPILEIGDSYEFYLNKTDFDEKHGQYYIIAGGYQGVFRKIENENIAISKENDLLNTNRGLLDVGPNDNTPAYPHYWDKTSLTVYMQTNIATLTSSDVLSGIQAGVQVWPLYTDAPSVSFISDFYLSDVRVVMDNYGANGMDAFSTWGTYIGSNECYVGAIHFNRYYNNDNHDYSPIWKAIACHEMGHILGLMHHVDGAISIMRDGTGNFHNRYGTPKWTTPQLRDIPTINSKY